MYLDDSYMYHFDEYDYEPEFTFIEDAQIRENIKDQMFWSPFVEADQVTVSVDSFAERNAATENAYEGGATWVDNDLVVSVNE